jgi:hypothetical protein
MVDRARANPKVEMVLSSEVVEATGGKSLESVTIRNNKTGELSSLVRANALPPPDVNSNQLTSSNSTQLTSFNTTSIILLPSPSLNHLSAPSSCFHHPSVN